MVPACQILQMNNAVRNLIRENKNHQIDNVIAAGGAEGMCTMDQAIMTLYRQGMITRQTALHFADHPEQFGRKLS